MSDSEEILRRVQSGEHKLNGEELFNAITRISEHNGGMAIIIVADNKGAVRWRWMGIQNGFALEMLALIRKAVLAKMDEPT